MRTVIHFRDGHAEVIDESFPSIDTEYSVMSCVNSDSEVLTDDVPLSVIALITWEND